jgi:hypothetical protein
MGNDRNFEMKQKLSGSGSSELSRAPRFKFKCHDTSIKNRVKLIQKMANTGSILDRALRFILIVHGCVTLGLETG